MEPETDTIVRRPLHAEVADRLRDLIDTGELSPGDRLNERVLSERFGISRTPLRDAIKILSSEGLIKLLPNRGAIVTDITRTEAENMFQVMAVLESLAGELACIRAGDDDIAEITALHEKMREYYLRGELEAYFALNQQIHEKIVETARNPELTAMYQSLSGRIRRIRYMANFSDERWHHAMEEHEEILDALTGRDSQRMKVLLQRHLENKLDTICAWLSDSEQAEPEAGSG